MIKRLLKKYDVEHLHYMTPMENVPLILALGIQSYNNLNNKKHPLHHRSIAFWSVQQLRTSVIPGTNKTAHDYVPLYFATHTPMQYVCTKGTRWRNRTLDQNDLLFIEVNAVKVFQVPVVIFTDGNAAASETKFYTEPDGLDKLDWKVINTQNCYSKEYKHKKAAEVLVPDSVPVKLFKRIVVFSKKASVNLDKEVKAWLKKGLSKNNLPYLSQYRSKVKVDPSHYYLE